jgi:hypothetical protein
MDLKSFHALAVFAIRRHHSAMMLEGTGRNLHICLADHHPA